VGALATEGADIGIVDRNGAGELALILATFSSENE